MDLIVVSPNLQNVVRAVTDPIQALSMTGLLGIFTIYIFALIGFYAFPHDFFNEDHARNECETMVGCFLTYLYNGLLSGGGIADYVTYELGTGPAFSGLTVHSWGGLIGRTVFDICFFILVLVLLLNIIFGIILDTFSALREDAKEQQENKVGRCFICGVDKNDIDEAFQKRNVTKGFESVHVAEEHNMWDYLFFMMHLRHKDPNDFTGAESYVFKCMDEEDIGWVPVNQAMSLDMKGEVTIEDQIVDNAEQLAKRIEELEERSSTSLQQLYKAVKDMHDKLEESMHENRGLHQTTVHSVKSTHSSRQK